MKLVKVIGSVTSTIKDDTLKGFKLLMVNTIGTDLKPTGDYYVAADTVGVGEGELALIVTGSTAKQTEATKGKNIDATIVAKVDRVNLEK
ncbi:EutN/CcmL family microcompartment protein [Actinomycetota bacterium]